MFFSSSCLIFYFIPTISNKDSRIKILTKLSILSSVIILGYHSNEFLTSKNVQRQRRVSVCRATFTFSRARITLVEHIYFRSSYGSRKWKHDSSNVCRFEPTQRVLLSFPPDFPETFISLEITRRTECIRLRTSYFVLSVAKYLSGSRSVRKFPAGCRSIRFPALDEDKEWTSSIGRFSCSGHRKRTHGKNTVRRQLSRAPMIFSVVRLSFSADFSYFEHFPNDPRIRRVSTRNSNVIRTDVHTRAGLKKWKRSVSLRVSTLSLNGTPFCRQQCVDSANTSF